MNILIMGAPGTGKGTMSQLIKEHYDVVHVSTGDMLRQAVENKTTLGLKVQEYMSAGALVPDEVIHNIILERLAKDDIKKGFLFDGYPRTVKQAIDLDEILGKLNMNIDCIINLDVDVEILKERITGRRTCRNCKEIYHIKNMPPKVEGTCDLCGGELITREDDTLEALMKRLDEYYASTKPVIDYYEKTGLVHNIDGGRDANEVFEDIKAILGGK
ncbi:MAG: adenylate kinase [Erysipelotrichaceae bacterium]|nr:adenylate kinase [Erysipelotrichaceae bacterium]